MVLTRGEKRALMPLEYYRAICEFTINNLDTQATVPLLDLIERTQQHFQATIKGDVSWYLLNVKQDLEARDIVKIVRERDRSQSIRLKRKYRARLAQSQIEVRSESGSRLEHHLAS